VSKDGLQIAYLRNSLGRSHFKACQLIIYSLETKLEKILVDIVSEPKTGFPGLFCQRIPSQRFTEKIYLNTCWFDLRVQNFKYGNYSRDLIFAFFSLLSVSISMTVKYRNFYLILREV
jgi:hypothetical protein